MAERRDYYDVLGVPRDASQQDIQRAYRKLARTYHPDVNKDPGAERRFQEIGEAYDVLSDADVRKRYDTFGHDFRQVPEGVDPETWRRATSGRARAGAGGRGGQPGWTGGHGGPDVSYRTYSGQDIDLEELFGDLFSGQGGGGFPGGSRRSHNGWGPIAGADQEAELVLSVEDAYRGGTRTITLERPEGTRSYDVRFPAGVIEGQRIRLGGQGGQGTGGAATGDLYLRVRLAPHPRYRVEGRDIFLTLPLSPWEAALGDTVPIDTPGEPAKVTVPPGTSSGRKLRLRGRGMPNAGGPPGDLYAEARIEVPKRLTSEERRLFEDLGRVSTFDPRRQR